MRHDTQHAVIYSKRMSSSIAPCSWRAHPQKRSSRPPDTTTLWTAVPAVGIEKRRAPV
jgi:hypothetical protein